MAAIAICDYGMGNLRSASKAFEHVGAEVVLSSDPGELRRAAGIVVPGVGAFPEAMRRISAAGIDAVVAERAAAGVPVLGICLGMQLLFGRSAEFEGADGLGLLGGEVTALDAPGLKVPHIGWAPVRQARESRLLEGVADGTPFYFVHSYAARPAEAGDLLGTAVYGEEFAALVERGTVFGAQFHPEKSSTAGLRMLANFTAICAAAPVAS